MKTASAPPYLLPPTDAIVAEPWHQAEDGGVLGDRLEHWDPFTDLALVQVMNLDLDLIRQACSLGNDSAFALSVAGYSGRTRLSVDGPTVELGVLGGRVKAPVTLSVPGILAGGNLDLRTRLVLRSPGEEPTRISPRRPGAVLWAGETRIALEGGAARFPVSATDFTNNPRFPTAASWALDWNPEDLEAPVLGGLRLLVNSADPALVGALRSGSGDARSSVMQAFVRFDIARSLIHAALRSERFVAAPEAFDDGSIGRMLSDLITACWAGVPTLALVARSHDDPARLDAEIQAFVGAV